MYKFIIFLVIVIICIENIINYNIENTGLEGFYPYNRNIYRHNYRRNYYNPYYWFWNMSTRNYPYYYNYFYY